MSQYTNSITETIEYKKARAFINAARFSGMTLGAIAGAVIGMAIGEWEVGPQMIVGMFGGVVAGFLILSRLAMCSNVGTGALAGGFLPIGVILIGAIRSGKFKMEGFLEGQAWVVFGIIFAVGAVVGALLVTGRIAFYALLAPTETEEEIETLEMASV